MTNNSCFELPVISTPRPHSWVPTLDLQPGMTLARPAYRGTGPVTSIFLAAGVQITAGIINQLLNKGVECVAVYIDEPLDEATHLERVVAYASHLREIFGDHPDEDCAALMNALIEEGPDV